MQLDDTILKTIEIAPDQELREARDLILRVRRRDLYQVFKLKCVFQSILIISCLGVSVAVS